MTLDERIAAVHQRATALYLERQALEDQRQALTMRARQIDLALVETDGELKALRAVKADGE